MKDHAPQESVTSENTIHASSAEFRSVGKVYGQNTGTVQALASVSFTVGRGEFVSILGPSGCGKSTLLMIIGGLLRPTTGEVAIDGIPVRKPHTDLGIVFQNPVLLEWRTSLENVMLQVEARRLSKKVYQQLAWDLLQSVGLNGFEHKYPYELSGGMRQRVSICRALVHEPRLLLMDEPFGSLDSLTRSQMNLDLQRMWLRKPMTVLFVTHSISEAVFLSDRIVVISPRPGTVDMILDVDLPRPRGLQTRKTPEFGVPVSKIEEVFSKRGILRE